KWGSTMKKRDKSESTSLGRLVRVLLIAGIVIGSLFAQTKQTFAAVANCLDDLSPINDFNCTPDDVKVAKFNVISGPTSCTNGQNITVTLQAEEKSGAAKRYDVGLFVALDGGNALTGSCYLDFLSPVVPNSPGCSTGTVNLTGGSGPYRNL